MSIAIEALLFHWIPAFAGMTTKGAFAGMMTKGHSPE